MAEGEDSQDKTEQPTEKRLRESREQGQVPRSRELATAAVFGTAVLMMISFGGWIGSRVATWLADALGRIGERVGNASRFPELFLELLGSLLWIVAPLIGACLLACFLPPLLLGGFNWSNKAMVPDFSKLDPIKGLQRIYGREGLAEFVRSLLRVAVIAGFGGYAIADMAPGLVALSREPLQTAIAHGFDMALDTLIAMAAGLLLIGLIDTPWQMWSHQQKLLMSRQELRDEMKESEGSPELKSKIRRMQQEAAQGRMLEAVPTADAILVNPTHYAVAISYNAAQMRAPKVVAKGTDLVAQTIRELADHHKVPIVSSPALARSLHRQVDIGHEVPVELYAAVAQVLTYVYQLRQWRRRGGRYPDLPPIDVPEAPDPKP